MLEYTLICFKDAQICLNIFKTERKYCKALDVRGKRSITDEHLIYLFADCINAIGATEGKRNWRKSRDREKGGITSSSLETKENSRYHLRVIRRTNLIVLQRWNSLARLSAVAVLRGSGGENDGRKGEVNHEQTKTRNLKRARCAANDNTGKVPGNFENSRSQANRHWARVGSRRGEGTRRSSFNKGEAGKVSRNIPLSLLNVRNSSRTRPR